MNILLLFSIALSAQIIATSLKYPIRGHQIGYRNTANSWDSWTMEKYEKNLLELALFGTNSLENIPFQENQNNPDWLTGVVTRPSSPERLV